jgi:hypothetical protein
MQPASVRSRPDGRSGSPPWRHLHLSPRPLVLGAAGRWPGEGRTHQLAAKVDTAPPDGRPAARGAAAAHRRLRFAFVADNSPTPVLPYVHKRLLRPASTCPPAGSPVGAGIGRRALIRFKRPRAGNGASRDRFTGAPQVLGLPNAAGVGFLALPGRSEPVPAHLTATYPVRAERPVARPVVDVHCRAGPRAPGPARCWSRSPTRSRCTGRPGRGALEDQNLAALLGGIGTRRPGRPGPRRAGRPRIRRCGGRPAGHRPRLRHRRARARDPRLRPRRRNGQARGAKRARAPRSNVRCAASSSRRGGSCGAGLDLLRALPPGGSVADRWAADRAAFTGFREHVVGGGPPQGTPRTVRSPSAVGSTGWSGSWPSTRRHARSTIRSCSRPHRVTGAAFAGTVVAVDRDRRVENANGTPVNRPMGRSPPPTRCASGRATDVVAVSRRNQTGTVYTVESTVDTVHVTLELRGGMGAAACRRQAASPGRRRAALLHERARRQRADAATARRRAHPWTHGGPPARTSPRPPTRPANDRRPRHRRHPRRSALGAASRRGGGLAAGRRQVDARGARRRRRSPPPASR